MTPDAERQHIDMARGHAVGELLMPTIRANAEECVEPVLYWAALIGYIYGCCGASIGHEALRAIDLIVRPLAENAVESCESTKQ